MGAFGHRDHREPEGQFDSDANKATPAVSTSYQVAHTLTATPRTNEHYARIRSIKDGLGWDSSLNSVVWLGRSITPEGGAEGADVDIGSQNSGVGTTRCTTDSYVDLTESGTPIRDGALGRVVTVKTKIRVNSFAAFTSVCAKNAELRGCHVRRRRKASAFRGSY